MDYHPGGKRREKKRQTSDMCSLIRQFKEEDVNNEEYPPLFQFHVVRDVCLRLAIKIESNMEVSPMESKI